MNQPAAIRRRAAFENGDNKPMNTGLCNIAILEEFPTNILMVGDKLVTMFEQPTM